MNKTVLGFAVAGCLVAVTSLGHAQQTDPQPTCKMCPGTYIPVSELEAYTKKAIAEKRVDQQVRAVDIGKSNVAIGMVRADQGLRDAIDAALEKLRADGTVERIYARYGVVLQSPK